MLKLSTPELTARITSLNFFISWCLLNDKLFKIISISKYGFKNEGIAVVLMLKQIDLFSLFVFPFQTT